MRNAEEGDVVILKEENALRNEWPIGVITKTIFSSDNCVRLVMVRTNEREYERPINKLVILVENEQ